MSTVSADLLAGFGDLRVLVIGEAMLDSYLHGAAERLSREAPVPIVSLERRDDAAGGAANTAVNVGRLGATVRLLSVVGEDAEAERLRAALRDNGVDDGDLLSRPGQATLAKHRVIAADQILVRFDSGSTDPVDVETEAELIGRVRDAWPDFDAVVVSDYGYGVVTAAVIDAVADLQKQMPRTLIVDARDLSRHQRVAATAVKPNYGEACRLLGERERSEPRSRAAQMASQGPRLLELTGARIAAVTLDTEGAFIFERGRPPYRTYARPQNHSRCAGAGDTFVSALALALAAGAGTPAASELASAAAAVVVAKDGTSACSADELRASLLVGVKRVDGAEKLAARIAFERARGRRIVFTNGCFDILHRGHVTYLNRAKALGDILVVGVNSDASVRRLKGESRPINLLDDRVGVLEALSCVDLVVPFSTDTPIDLIRRIQPDVYTKGGDYTIDRLPEAEVVERFGGVVQILPLVDDRSTSRIIERVLDIQPAASAADGRPRRTRKVATLVPGRR
jgi:D-beta-D-heptose 7-phosphate kinase/D-beta-D-heptose 1-phosphate adenosyltransferase